MANKPNPLTPYIVRSSIVNGYTYAHVQKMVEIEKTGTKERRKVNIGKLIDGYRFVPNKEYRLMPVVEKRKLQFPPEWDISAAQKLEGGLINPLPDENDGKSPDISTETAGIQSESDLEESKGSENDNKEQIAAVINTSDEHEQYESSGNLNLLEKADVDLVSSLAYSCKIYGAVWLLEQIGIKKGVQDDLLSTFDNDIGMMNDVMTMAIYTVAENRGFYRLDRWQDTHKTPSDHRFGSDYVTRLSQTITEDHRMRFIKARLERQPEGAKGSIGSTSRSGYGKCLVDLRWGKNKDRDDLPCSLEVYVYSLTTHEPIYYKRMSGNTNDMVTIRTILTELTELGLKPEDMSFTTDRGYCSKENMGAFHKMGAPFLMCAKVGQLPVIQCLTAIRYDEFGLPINMEYDKETKLYYCQMEAESFKTMLENGNEYVVAGVKVNAFLNLQDRLVDAHRVREAIQQEKRRIEALRSGKETMPEFKRLQSSLNYHRDVLDKQSGDISFDENTDVIKKAYAQCGFFASCMYKHEITAIEAYHEYISRDEHEKNFFNLKQDENANMQDCSTEESADGRSFIYFVGLILLNTLKHVWGKSLKPRFKSASDVLDAMEPIRFSEFISGNTHMTTFTGEQVVICDACGVEPPTECLTATSKEVWRRAHSPSERGRKPKNVITQYE
ncbi:MAG: transposase [Clostridia bacterium]|nr:transposase [Clostridia bacterium]